jgi:hypothetical protein
MMVTHRKHQGWKVQDVTREKTAKKQSVTGDIFRSGGEVEP